MEKIIVVFVQMNFYPMFTISNKTENNYMDDIIF